MKKILFIILLALPLTVLAEEFSPPILSASQVIERVLQHENLDKNNVKVILLNLDFLQRQWHLELAPTHKTCLDCYPAYYIEDAQEPKIESLMHG